MRGRVEDSEALDRVVFDGGDKLTNSCSSGPIVESTLEIVDEPCLLLPAAGLLLPTPLLLKSHSLSPLAFEPSQTHPFSGSDQRPDELVETGLDSLLLPIAPASAGSIHVVMPNAKHEHAVRAMLTLRCRWDQRGRRYPTRTAP